MVRLTDKRAAIHTIAAARVNNPKAGLGVFEMFAAHSEQVVATDFAKSVADLDFDRFAFLAW